MYVQVLASDLKSKKDLHNTNPEKPRKTCYNKKR